MFEWPDRSFLPKEIIALAASGIGTVHRELKRFIASGLITVHSADWEKYYQANWGSPVFGELSTARGKLSHLSPRCVTIAA